MKIEVVEYNPKWSELFEKEKQLLIKSIGAIAKDIHHIGSTSVEGLSAKPIIDIILETKTLDSLDKSKERFESLGYEVMGEFGISGRRYYRKGGENRTHQIHAFEIGDSNITRHIAFRDYLKAHPAVRLDYQNLKKEVAEKCENNIQLYCEGKDAFVKEHEAKALKWLKRI